MIQVFFFFKLAIQVLIFPSIKKKLENCSNTEC